jgi:hypothetical protein
LLDLFRTLVDGMGAMHIGALIDGASLPYPLARRPRDTTSPAPIRRFASLMLTRLISFFFRDSLFLLIQSLLLNSCTRVLVLALPCILV